MKPVVKWLLFANLAVLAALSLVYPHLMVGPGKLIPGHKQLEQDCFACHAGFRGAVAERCASCHKPADIGRLSTTGAPIVKPLTGAMKTPFHQKLISQDCMACHSDHAGVRRYPAHGSFKHAMLQKEARELCQGCHVAPRDALHGKISGNCIQCHSQEKWTPATFDHEKFFALDRDHNVKCVTCHLQNDYSRYTCYGCHEHTPANIRREHIEEGIRDFDNCVDCHRNADEDDIRRPDGSRRGGHDDGRRKKDDD